MHTIGRMEFTCDAIKNDTNVRERGLPLLAARVMFDAGLLVREDTRKAYPERRFVGYNTIEGRLMVVVFCCPTPMRTHIISFRKANNREQKKFKAQGL
ncbi:MAG: BrnT family toxin [Comamonadaceae bacterium CG_4_10_14_3_um_filter_60_75]|nr:MAG: BrnT family toxin [Comamonadaceae bacterium CG_4_10_14_3_um_filter_60_75]